jgi:cytosine/adenosine deaminase-related metal-dependent hydrolase
MKKALKWIGITAAIVVALGIIGYVALYIYDPGISWAKPGIPQTKIPAGVDTSVVFENVTVIPMDSERILEAQTVVIEDQRITAIGTSAEIEIPADAHVVDGSGRFLIPGLSDMIVHTNGSENDLLVYLANGVTTIRIMGQDPSSILKWRDQIRAGTRVGPNMWVWWPQFENNEWDDEGGMERSTRGGMIYLHTPEEAEQLVAEMAALGVDGIKAHGVVSSEIYLALLESAAKHGLPFDGHAPEDHTFSSVFETRSDAWNDFRTMGVPALTHVEELVKMVELSDENTRQASDEHIRKIAQDAADDGLWVTTTIYLFRSIAEQAADLEGMLAGMPELKYVHPGVFDGMKWGPDESGANWYTELGARPWYPNYLGAQEKMLLALNESGAPLMSGTDVPMAVIVPGFSLHNELETMADVGLSPYDVLKTSTHNPALYLGELDEFGTVEVGKRADLVLLEANPLEDITNTRQIVGTMVRGRYFDRTDLDTILEMVALDYVAAKTNQTVVKIAFPVVVILLLLALVLFVVIRRARRLKASQIGS